MQAEGDSVSLNQWLVQQGWALNFEPYSKGRFKLDEDDALTNGRGTGPPDSMPLPCFWSAC